MSQCLGPKVFIQVKEVVVGGIATLPEAVLRILLFPNIKWIHVKQDALCIVNTAPFLQALFMGSRPQLQVSFFEVTSRDGVARGLGKDFHTYDHLLDVPGLPVIRALTGKVGLPLIDYHDTAQFTPLAPVAVRLGFLLAYSIYQITAEGSGSSLAQQLMDADNCQEAQEVYLTTLRQRRAVMTAAQMINRQALVDELRGLLAMLPVIWRKYLFEIIITGIFADPASTVDIARQVSEFSQVHEPSLEAPATHSPKAEAFAGFQHVSRL
jgi:hypothetical protein